MSKYTFSLDRDEKEALYFAFQEAVQHFYSRTIFTEELEETLDPRSEIKEITLTDKQLNMGLRFIDKAIQTQETDHGDWSKAVSWRKARESIISKTRNQFGVVKEG